MRNVILIATAGLTALASAGCGGSPDVEPGAPSRSASAEAQVTISVVVQTDSGLVAPNHDDVSCLWPKIEYELRDESGTIIAADRWSDDGASVGDTQWAAVGNIEGPEGSYRCVLDRTIRTPSVEFYTLKVTVDSPLASTVEGEATFARDGARPVRIEISR